MDLKVGYLVDYRCKVTGGVGLAEVTEIYENKNDNSILLRLKHIEEKYAPVFYKLQEVEVIKVYKEIC